MTFMAAEAAAPEAAPAAARARARPRTRTTRAGSTVVTSGGGSKVSTAHPKVPKKLSNPQRLQPPPPPKTPARSRPSMPQLSRTHRGNYQGVILAEFVAAIILTAATPISTGKNKAGLSPYASSDVAQLAALTLVYLILALLSMGGHGAGKFAAWFGGLILLGVGLGEASTIAKTLNLFGGGSGPGLAQSGLAEGSAGQINPNAPSTSPAQPTTGPGLAEGSAGPLGG